MPDYGPYLERIAEALQRTTTPTWVIALLGAVVGGLFAVGAQLVKAIYDEHRRRRLFSVMMHHELKKNFLTLYGIWDPMTKDGRTIAVAWLVDFFKLAFDFSGREVLRKAPEIYLLMPEHWKAETIYIGFDRVAHAGPKDLDYHIKNALYMYAWNFLNDEQFKKAVTKGIGRKGVDEIRSEAQECIGRIGIMPALFSQVQASAQQST
jgi:hypothetical protein